MAFFTIFVIFLRINAITCQEYSRSLLYIFYSTECKTAKQYIKGTSNGAVVDSDTVITTLDDITVIKLDFTVPETYLSVLGKGMNVAAQSPAYPDRNFNGTIIHLQT